MDKSVEWDLPPATGEEAVLDPYANTAPTATLSEDAAKKRANKVAIAFSGDDNPPGYEEILADVQSQREDRLKERLATSEAIRKTKAKQDLIRQVVDSGDTSPDQVAFLQSLSAEEITDNTGILDKKYAEWRVNLGLTADDSGTVDKALEKNPDGVNEAVDKSVDRITRKTHLEQLRAEADALYQQTGVGRTLIDFGFSMLPWAEALEAKNLTPDNVNSEGILRSDFRRSQVRDLYAMPMKEFYSTMEKIRQDAIDAGDYAPYIKLLDDLQKYTASQGLVDNTWDLISLVELAPGGLVWDAVKGGVSIGKAGVRAAAAAEARRAATEAVAEGAGKGGSGDVAKAAEEAVAASSAEANSAESLKSIGNIAGAISDNLHKMLWEKVQKGVVTELGKPSPLLVEAKKLRDAGGLKTPEEFRKFVNDFTGKGTTTVTAEGQTATVNSEAISGYNYLRSVGYTDEQIRAMTPEERAAARSATQPAGPSKEAVLSAVAEKAAGNPKSLDELAQEIQNSYTIDGQVLPMRSGLIQEYETAVLARDIADRKIGGIVTSRFGDKYRITELSNEEMIAKRGDGRNPLGFINLSKYDPTTGANEIYVNVDKIANAFKAKWWTQGNGLGLRPLPEDTFKTLEEFKAFVIEHEITHIYGEDHVPWKNVFLDKDKVLKLEEAVNANALLRMGKVDAVRKAYPEYFAKVVASGPDPGVAHAPQKLKEVVKPVTQPTPQSISIPKTEARYRALKAKIKDLNEEIQKTYPKGSPTSAGVPDKGARRLALNEQLKQAQKELYELKKVIDSKPYQIQLKSRRETIEKIKVISEHLKFPSKYYPDLKGKAWLKKKLSLEKELKAEQAKFAQTERLDTTPRAEVEPNTVQASDAVDRFGNKTPYSPTNLPKKQAPDWQEPVTQATPESLHSRMTGVDKLNNQAFFVWYDRELEWIRTLLASSDAELLKRPELKHFKNADSAREALTIYRESVKDLSPFLDDANYVTVDIPNPATGGSAPVQVPADDETLSQIFIRNIEAADMADNGNDLPNTFAAHGDLDRAAVAESFDRVMRSKAKDFKNWVKTASEDLVRKLPTIYDPSGAITGRPLHNDLYKLANNLAEKYKSVIDRQKNIQGTLWEAFGQSHTMGALRWSDNVFEAVQDAAKKQMDNFVGSPSSAILNIKFLREWETIGRTNQIAYQLGTPDGRTFESLKQASKYAKENYGLPQDSYSIYSLNPKSYYIVVSKTIDETDPDILKYAIQTDTKTPVSWTGAFLPYLRGAAGLSSDTLMQNLRISSHHAKALHEAFMVAAKDIGTLSKKELTRLEALMDAKRKVEKIVIDPKTLERKTVVGEWFNTAAELENTYKKAFGEYPSENVVSAYFTHRQMYDFDLLHRNLKLYTEKTRKGFEIAKLYLPWTDDQGMIRWTQQKEGVEVKVLDEVPAGNVDVLVLDSDTFLTHQFNTGKAGIEGIKALQEKGYKILQLVAPDQRPLKGVTTNYVNLVIAKDFDRVPLTVNQLPATEGGHIRYNENFFVKQPRFEVTENGEKLYLGDRSILGASSEAEAALHAKNIEIGRQLLVAGKIKELGEHLADKLPWTVGKFEELFMPKMSRSGQLVEEALLDKNTPIVWVADAQGTNDAAKTHAAELRQHFSGVRDTIDDPLNEMAGIGKKFTGEKDTALHKIVRNEKNILEFQKARMISPLETLEQAWAEISRSMATDNLKIQAATTWVEEAADALQIPIEELRRNPWEALNNPQWNKQYGDIARIRTLDAQRLQILNFLAQRDQLGTTMDWLRNKLLNSVFERKGQAAADWVDDHLLPNVRNPLAFMRSFAFHTKMGFFNPIQLFLQMNTLVNTWAITGNVQRVGSALSGLMLMQMARVNRNPEILAALGKKAEKLGWKPGEFEEMDQLFHKFSLHIVEGEVGTLDVMTNPKMFKGIGGAFLDKGLIFFREGERAVRANAFAVAYKEFRDKFPTKVISNADENRILSRSEVLAGMMNRGDMALWQKGLTGPMTQFWGYQARIMEQLLGKTLTRAEKLRLGTAFAAMYGIPVSLSAATMFQIPGWSTDDLRQYALENNIDVNSGLLSVAMNGILAEVIRWMTSDENGQGGVLLSIGDRYGPGGLPVIKNLLEAKDGVADAIIDLAFGASGSTTRDFFAHVLPDDWDIIDATVNAPQMTMVDFANMFSTISTVNNSTKLYWALTTHRNMTRDGMDLGDKSPLSAWISFTTGLEEQRFKDTFLKMDSLKDFKTATEELGKEYIKQIRQAKLLPAGSEERARRIKKARALLEGLDPKDQKKYLKLALKPQGNLQESVDSSFKKLPKE